MHPRQAVAAAPTAEAVVAAFGSHLSVARGLSAHTVRAYAGDVRHVVGFARRRGRGWDEVDLPLLRGWLAGMVAAGLARSTIARRGAAVRTFYAWAVGEGLLPADPAVRLVTAHPGVTLPTSLGVRPAAQLIEVAREAAADGDPVPLRDWAVL